MRKKKESQTHSKLGEYMKDVVHTDAVPCGCLTMRCKCNDCLGQTINKKEHIRCCEEHKDS